VSYKIKITISIDDQPGLTRYYTSFPEALNSIKNYFKGFIVNIYNLPVKEENDSP